VFTGIAPSNDTAGPYTIGGGFTVNAEQVDWAYAGAMGAGLAHLLQTSAAAANPTWTLGSGNGEIAAVIASFKTASGGGAATSLVVPRRMARMSSYFR
jgi:hypothetical protein